MNSFHQSKKRQKHSDQIIQLMEDRRNERNEIVKGLSQNHSDDVDLFFKSIAMSVKKLSPGLINEAKMESLKMVFDLERRNTISFSTPSPTFGSFPTSSSSSTNDNFRNWDNSIDYDSSSCTEYQVLDTFE